MRTRRPSRNRWATITAIIGFTAAMIAGVILESSGRAPAAPTAGTAGSSGSSGPSQAPAVPPSITPSEPTSAPSSEVGTPTPEPPPVSVGDRATISIPAIDIDELTTVFYRGGPDDGPGTKIQDTGGLAGSIGPEGGVGPGQVGNLIVAGHRISHGGPLRDLPELDKGDHVLVTYEGMVYDYKITGSLWITFHDPDSYALQVAPVPGHPGREPTKPMITLTTCATPEDRAAGIFELDEQGNPPHRIDKIGVLVDVRPA